MEIDGSQTRGSGFPTSSYLPCFRTADAPALLGTVCVDTTLAAWTPAWLDVVSCGQTIVNRSEVSL